MKTGIAIAIVTVAAASAALAVVDRRLRGRRRTVAILLLAIATVLSFRFAAFGRFGAWHGYANHLQKFRDLTSVQWSLVTYEQLSRKDAPKQYLAFGSSQTNKLLSPPQRKGANMQTVTVPSIMPLEYPFYAELIGDGSYETAVLFVSEFDLAKQTRDQRMVTLPGRPGAAIDLAKLSGEYPVFAGSKASALATLAVSQLVPEFRNRFLLAAMLDRARDRYGVSGPKESTVYTATSSEAQTKYMRSQLLKTPYIRANLAALDEFVTVLENKGVSVVIFQGQYAPRVRTPEIETTRAWVAEELSLLAHRHRRTRFVPTSEQYVMTDADFDQYDPLHPLSQAADRWAKQAKKTLSSLDLLRLDDRDDWKADPKR